MAYFARLAQMQKIAYKRGKIEYDFITMEAYL